MAECEFLTTFDEEALEHHAGDAALTVGETSRNLGRDVGLSSMVLATVAMARVDDETRRQPSTLEALESVGDLIRAVVRSGGAATQNDVAVGVAGGREDRADAFVRDAWEHLTSRRDEDRVNGALNIAFSRVLEADRHRQSTCQLAMDLAVCRRTRRSPPSSPCPRCIAA